MKRIGIFAVLMVMAFMTIAGLHLTFHAGEVDAEVPGDSNMRGRYGTLSTTPIDDLNKLNGISSNVQDQLDAKTTSSLADTKIFIGNSGGTANAQTVSGLATISNAGVLTGTLADAKVWIGNSGGEAVAVTPSGDWTITNAGVASLAANTVADTELAWLKETLIINAGATSNSTSASATYNGTLMVQPWQNTNDAYIINTTMIANGTATVVVNGAVAADYKVQVIRTKQ
jgi:hypothetical protein